MTARVPASDRTRQQIADVLSGDFDQSALLRNVVRLIIEEALEAEVMDVLGRGYSERGEPAGYRNGNRLGRLKTAEGSVEYAVLRVTGTAEPWASQIKQALSGWTEELERLVVDMSARGLSMRDLEAAFTGADGRCVLSKSAASSVTERLWADYLAFAGRDLAGQPILYLFLDGVAERLHLGQPREPVLAAWGIAASGAKVLLGLDLASEEDAASARECLRDPKARGMNEPVLVATDGAGLIRAVEEVFPHSLRQRCLAHKLRNLGAKVPEERGREVKAHALAAYQALSPAARAAAEEFRRRYAREFPSAVACFEDDFEACIAHLRLPIAHRKAIRTTTLPERLFGEERRRTKTIPHAFGERAVLKLMFAALARASQSWRRLVIGEFELKQIEELKTELQAQFRQRTAPVASSTASRLHFSSNNKT